MTAPDDGLEALLAEHDCYRWTFEDTMGHIDPDGGIVCDCGTAIPEQESGYAEDWHRQHVAAVVRAAGWMRVFSRSSRSSFDFDVATGRPLGPPEQEKS